MSNSSNQDAGALRAKLEFPIWYRAFVRTYAAWSSAPSDLKSPLLLTGPALAKAEAWLLSCPEKLSDSEKRFIVRSIAQRSKSPPSASATIGKRGARKGWRRSSDRNLWHLYAVIALGLWFFSPDFIKDLMERSLNKPDAYEELQRSKVAGAAPPVVETEEVAAGPGDAEVTTAPARADPQPLPVQAAPPTAAPASAPPAQPQHSSGSMRLADLSRERMAAGDSRAGLLLAIEAAELGTAMEGEAGPSIGVVRAALFRAMARQEVLGPLAATSASATPAVFCEGAKALVAIAQDGTPTVWPAGAGDRTSRPNGIGTGSRRLEGATFDRDCRRVLVTNEDHNAEIWQVTGGKATLELSGHEASILTAAFSPDGQTIVTGGQDSNARLWDARTGRSRGVLAGHDWHVVGSAFSPDGRRVVTASSDMTARVWDVATGRQLHILAGHQGVVTSATFSSDGTQILTTSWDGYARLWDAASGKSRVMLSRGKDSIMSAALSRDGRRIATIGSDAAVQLWDAATGNLIGELAPDTDNIRNLAFSADGRWLATVAWDGKVVLRSADSGALLSTLSATAERVQAIAFGTDARTLVGLTDDGKRLTWPLFVTTVEGVAQAKGLAPQCLSADERTLLGLGAEQPQWCNELRSRGASLPH